MQNLQIIKKIGEGTYSNVFLVNYNGQQKALRAPKTNIKKYLQRGIDSLIEIDILTRIRHPHLLYADELIQHKDYDGIVQILPYVPETIRSIMKKITLTDFQKTDISFKVICAARFLLMECNILHLDVSPSNILIEDNLNPFLSDFGLVIRMDDPNAKVYTPSIKIIDYLIPYEQFINPKHEIGEHTLVWQLGVLLLYIFTKTYPKGSTYDELKNYYQTDFSSENKRATLSKILEKIDTNIKDDLIELIGQMLDINPTERIKLNAILSHKLWQHISDSEVPEGSLQQSRILPDKRPIISGTVLNIKNTINIDAKDVMGYTRSIERFCNQFTTFPRDEYFSRIPSGIFFIGIDLIYRTYSLVSKTTIKEILTHNMTCFFMAAKFYDAYIKGSIEYDEFFEENSFIKKHKILNKDITKMEVRIILYLQGHLYRPYIYDHVNANNIIQTINTFLLNPEKYNKYTRGASVNCAKPGLEHVLKKLKF